MLGRLQIDHMKCETNEQFSTPRQELFYRKQGFSAHFFRGRFKKFSYESTPTGVLKEHPITKKTDRWLEQFRLKMPLGHGGQRSQQHGDVA